MSIDHIHVLVSGFSPASSRTVNAYRGTSINVF